jgi:hypothetical protein
MYLDIINSCTSFSLKNKCDLEFYVKVIVPEKKIRIWQTNFETTTRGLPEHKPEFFKECRIYGIVFNRLC